MPKALDTLETTPAFATAHVRIGGEGDAMRSLILLSGASPSKKLLRGAPVVVAITTLVCCGFDSIVQNEIPANPIPSTTKIAQLATDSMPNTAVSCV